MLEPKLTYFSHYLFQAIAQQKYREHQEFDRRRQLEESRNREHDKWAAVADRRRAIEVNAISKKKKLKLK